LNNKKLRFFGFSPQRKIITVFLLVMSAISVVVGFFSLNGGAGQAFWAFFPLFYFFALLLITYNLHNLKKILRKAYKPLIVIFYSGMILFFAVFTVFSILILGYGADTPENPDLVIVMGCQTYGYKPSKLLKSRLDKSVEVLNKYPEVLCIVSGGQGPDETVPEAVAMKKYLVDNGIDEKRIYEESESSSSMKNLIFSKKTAADNNLKSKNIIIITNEYHVPRAMMIAKRVYADTDAKLYAVKAKLPYPITVPFFNPGIMREFFAFVKSYIYDRV